jgi:hypothetical protein
MRGLTPGLTDQSVASAGVEDTADQIHELVAAEFTLQETGGTLTADGTEQTLYINNNPLGVFRPTALFVDLDNMVQGDTTVLRVYYRLKAGGTLKLEDYQSYTGADGGLANGMKLVALDLYPNRFGIQITLEQTATGNGYSDYDWSTFTEE